MGDVIANSRTIPESAKCYDMVIKARKKFAE